MINTLMEEKGDLYVSAIMSNHCFIADGQDGLAGYVVGSEKRLRYLLKSGMSIPSRIWILDII